MGLLTDYFVAASDEAAAAVDLDAPLPHALDGGGIDPLVELGSLEEILTGRTFDDILDDEWDPVAEGDGDVVVVRISPHLERALVDVTDARLAEAAVPWSATEELEGSDPADLAAFAQRLAALARRARDEGGHVYCRSSV